jgi:hypothetical protein|mmetsp:Transcript_14689/g.2418  ORF Transcript_14689/g.2418 Transcript_14689/m.2418 type:complete len:86 (-) Transcript_14689:645-902(-)
MVITTGNSELPFHLCILYPSSYASCALITESSLFRLRKLLTATALYTKLHPRISFDFHCSEEAPVSESTGSDHRRSQNSPYLGGS